MGINFVVSFDGGDVSIFVPIVFGKIKIGINFLKLCTPFSCIGTRSFEWRSSIILEVREVPFRNS